MRDSPSPPSFSWVAGDHLRKKASSAATNDEKSAIYLEAVHLYEIDLATTPMVYSAALLHYGKGVALRKLERHAEAVQEFDASLELDPRGLGSTGQLGAVWDNKGTSLLKLQRYNEAVEAYNEAVKLSDGKKEYKRGVNNSSLQ